MSKLDELKLDMTKAVKVFTDTGDMSAIQAVTAEMNKAKGELAKVESAKLLKESEALAGQREALGATIQKIVQGIPNIATQLAGVKAKGFTYTIDHKETAKGAIDPNGEVSVKGGVGLLVTAVKARKSGNGAGRKGGLQEDFDNVKQFYPDAQAELEAALDKDSTVDNQGFSYAVKKRYQKKGIADGHLQPVK